jgi:hypothetical protein
MHAAVSPLSFIVQLSGEIPPHAWLDIVITFLYDSQNVRKKSRPLSSLRQIQDVWWISEIQFHVLLQE